MTDLQTLLDSMEDESLKTELTNAITAEKASLVGNHDRALAEKKNLDAKVKNLGGMDSLIEAKEALNAADKATSEANMKKAEAEGDVKAIKAQHQEQMDAKDKRFNSLQDSLLQKEATSKLSQAIKKENGSVELLEPHLRSRVNTTYNDEGEIVTEVLKDGKAWVLDNGSMATLADLVKETAADDTFTRLFDDREVSGSGATRTVARATGARNAADMSVDDIMAAVKKDPAKFESFKGRLKELAEADKNLQSSR